MNINWKKIMAIGLAVFSVGMMGCASKEQANDDYLICNQTSNGVMVETEKGYYFVFNQFLYYSDKENLETWVAVCNKPECFHNSSDRSCNAYLPSTTIWQKDGKLYGLGHGDINPYVYQITLDGNGLTNVYEVPVEGNPSGTGYALFQDEFVIRYNYLDEKGNLQERIISLKSDENDKESTDTLYKDIVNNASLVMSGNECWGIRGENLIVTTQHLKEGGIAMENLCTIDNGQIEPLNLSDDIDIYGGYFENDIFTYYKQQEGFYQYNVTTGEQKLLLENQLEDGQGFILSEDCIIECNRYLQYTPEEAHLKFYNGEEWIDVEVPEEIAESNDPFYPVSVASNRIFFRRNVMTERFHLVGVQIYCMMLEEETPELIFAGKIGEDVIEKETSTEIVEEDNADNFEEVIVFDTEEYLVKVTDVYLDYSNRCCVDFYFENRSQDKKYDMFANNCAINGIQCNASFGITTGTGTSTLQFINKMVDRSKVSEFYNASEYTDIEFAVYVSSWSDGTREIEQKIVHLYPQGKENAVRFTRERQENDIALVDDANALVLITGYDELFVPNDMINVLIENKTDQLMLVKVEEASANGIAVEPNVYYGIYWTVVNPGAVVMYPMTLFDENQTHQEGGYQPDSNSSFLTSNNITSIEEIQMKLKLITYWDSEDNGEVVVDKTFVLNP